LFKLQAFSAGEKKNDQQMSRATDNNESKQSAPSMQGIQGMQGIGFRDFGQPR
jgi:hypothetical protein